MSSQPRGKLTQRRAELHLRSLISFLFEERTGIVESATATCQRYVDSVNAFFDAEVFFASFGPRDSLRIACQCGWSLSLVPPSRLALQAVPVPLDCCLNRMVLHYEIEHCSQKETENLR